MPETSTTQVDVGDAAIGVRIWPGSGPPAPLVLAVHGITANAWSWAAVARHLDGERSVAAVDLRGRGLSASAPPPYGMRQHADDVAAVIAELGRGEPAVVVAHSMGTYVALMCAERHPALVSSLVLVDGGVPLPLPDGIDPQDALDLTLGPAIARLRQVWPDRESYRAMWAEHPAFAAATVGDGRLSDEVERYVMSDLDEADGGFRSIVSEDAVRFDGAELLTDHEVRTALDRHLEPIRMIRAEFGLFGAPPPLVAAEYVDRYPRHEWVTVEGSNHYDVLIGDAGAAAVAAAIRSSSPTP